MVLCMSHSSELIPKRIKLVMERTLALETQMPDEYTRINKWNTYCWNEDYTEIRQPAKETEKSAQNALFNMELYKWSSFIV